MYSSEIHLLEIKNWSGFVQESENSWRQRRNGDFVDHRNPVSENSRKISAFVEYLSDSGTELTKEFVDSRIRAQIILFNERLHVSPEISKNPDVIQQKELDQFLDETCRVSALQSNTRRLIDKCFNEQLSDRIQKIRRGMHGPPTGKSATPFHRRTPGISLPMRMQNAQGRPAQVACESTVFYSQATLRWYNH